MRLISPILLFLPMLLHMLGVIDYNAMAFIYMVIIGFFILIALILHERVGDEIKRNRKIMGGEAR